MSFGAVYSLLTAVQFLQNPELVTYIEFNMQEEKKTHDNLQVFSLIFFRLSFFHFAT